jgi:hypothetical protein
MTEGNNERAASAPVHAFVHTPGPWRYEGNSIVYSPAHGGVSPVPKTPVNMRLSALAPEMLETLQAIAQLDYTRAATNGAAYDAVLLARNIISKVV